MLLYKRIPSIIWSYRFTKRVQTGSDCNGTPISIRANQEGVSIQDIADRYHQEFVDNFSKLGFSYDCYSRTDDQQHHEIVQQIFLQLLENGYIYKKEIEQTYCEFDKQFLPDLM